jgi:hypothetical protein
LTRSPAAGALIFILRSQTKEITNMVYIGKLNAARRDENVVARLRAALKAAGIHPDSHEDVIDACDAAGLIPGHFGGGELHASADDVKKARLAKLNAAMDSDDSAIRSNATILVGLLRRGGLCLTDVAGGSIAVIDKAFAASKLSTTDKIAAKGMLFRLGAID